MGALAFEVRNLARVSSFATLAQLPRHLCYSFLTFPTLHKQRFSFSVMASVNKKAKNHIQNFTADKKFYY